jgi:hypothetical protein
MLLQSSFLFLKGSPGKSLLQFMLGSFFFVCPCSAAFAQTSTTEFLPEIDADAQLRSDVRFEFQAKQTREGGEPTQAELGPSVSFYLKPLLKLKDSPSLTSIFPSPGRLFCQSDIGIWRRRTPQP